MKDNSRREGETSERENQKGRKTSERAQQKRRNKQERRTKENEKQVGENNRREDETTGITVNEQETCVQVERLDLDSNVFPGEVWTANQQCQTFLLDSDARIDHTDKDFSVSCLMSHKRQFPSSRLTPFKA